MTLTYDEAQKLGWAQESTLQKLLDASRGTPQMLKLLGERFKINQVALEQAYRGIEASARSTRRELGRAGQEAADSIKQATDRESNARRRDADNLKEIQSRLGTSITDQLRALTNVRDPQSMIGGIAGRLRGAAAGFEKAGGSAGALAGKLVIISGSLSVFNDMLERITAVMSAMQGVYASGVLLEDGLTGLTQAAGYSGVTFREFSDLLSRNAAVAVTLGTRSTVQLSRRFQQLTGFSGELMMSQEEGGRAFFEVMEMMRTSGEMTGMTQEQLAQRGTGLLRSFNELAIATGRNRDELRRQTADIMRQPLVSLYSRMLPTEGRKQLTDFTARMTSQFGDQARTLVNMVERVGAAGGSFALIDDAMKPLISIVPGFGQALQAASNSNLSAEEKTNMLARSLDGLTEGNMTQLRTLSMANPALAAQVEALLQAREQSKRAREQLEREARQRGLTIEQLEEERRETARRMGQIRSSMNGANAAVNRLTNAFSKIAASLSGVITPALDLLAGGINAVAFVIETLADVIQPVVDGFDFVRRTMMEFIDGIFGIFGMGRDAGTEVSGSSLSGMIGTVVTLLASGVVVSAIVSLAGKVMGAGAIASLFSKLPGMGMLGSLGTKGAAGTGSAVAGAGAAAGGAAARGAGAVGSALGSMGTGSQSMLEGLANGLKAFGTGSAKILLGASTLAASITIIGAGIAGATWIMGKALPSLADGLRPFAEINGEALKSTGSGMLSLGAGLAAMAAGNIVSGISSLVNLLPNLFGGGPMGQLRQFADLAPRLELASTSIATLTQNLTNLTSLDLRPLQGLMAISQFANSMNERTISNLSRTVNNPQFIESVRNIALAVQPPAPAATAPVSGTNEPVITTGELNQRTIEYYDTSLRNLTEMVELMRIANMLTRENNEITERGSTAVVTAVGGIGRI